MNIPASYEDLIRSLLDKTNKNEIVWSSASNDETYVVFLKKFGFTIKRYFDSGWYIEVSIVNNEGKKLDGFWISGKDTDFKLMDDLYNAIHKITHNNINSIIKEMLSELKTNKKVGGKENTLFLDNFST